MFIEDVIDISVEWSLIESLTWALLFFAHAPGLYANQWVRIIDELIWVVKHYYFRFFLDLQFLVVSEFVYFYRLTRC